MHSSAVTLTLVGLSIPGERPDSDLVLVALSALGRGTEAEVGARTGLPPAEVRAHLDALADEHAAMRLGEDLWEVATTQGVRNGHWVADLRQRFDRESETPAEHRRLLTEGSPSQRPGVRTYVGARAALAVHFQLLEQDKTSVWVLDRPPYLGGLPVPEDGEPDNPEMRAFARGVDVRGVYSAGFRHIARLWYLREFVQSGVPVRIGSAPIKLAIIDGRVAYLPTQRSYDVPDHVTAAVVWDPALVQVLLELFEQSWDSARPIPLALANEDDARQRELTAMLLAGSTDVVIARALEVTERTVRRWVRDLLTLTGSETRLQLGAALAAHRDAQRGDVR